MSREVQNVQEVVWLVAVLMTSGMDFLGLHALTAVQDCMIPGFMGPHGPYPTLLESGLGPRERSSVLQPIYKATEVPIQSSSILKVCTTLVIIEGFTVEVPAIITSKDILPGEGCLFSESRAWSHARARQPQQLVAQFAHAPSRISVHAYKESPRWLESKLWCACMPPCEAAQALSNPTSCQHSKLARPLEKVQRCGHRCSAPPRRSASEGGVVSSGGKAVA